MINNEQNQNRDFAFFCDHRTQRCDSWIPDENEGFSVNRLAWVVDDV